MVIFNIMILVAVVVISYAIMNNFPKLIERIEKKFSSPIES